MKSDNNLFLRLVEIVFGAMCVAAGFYLAKGSIESYSSTDAAWIYLTIGALGALLLMWGLTLIAKGLFPESRLLSAMVGKDSLAGANEAGCLTIVIAAPLYLLVRFLRRDDRSN